MREQSRRQAALANVPQARRVERGPHAQVVLQPSQRELEVREHARQAARLAGGWVNAAPHLAQQRAVQRIPARLVLLQRRERAIDEKARNAIALEVRAEDHCREAGVDSAK